MTIGAYFRSFYEIEELMQKIKSRKFQPLPPGKHASKGPAHSQSHVSMTAEELEDEDVSKKGRLRYGLWSGLHKLQGFETRFGLKAAIATALLSIPAWLPDHGDWWNAYEAWWAVVMVWLIMGPR